jgi:hypothetical protein
VDLTQEQIKAAPDYDSSPSVLAENRDQSPDLLLEPVDPEPTRVPAPLRPVRRVTRHSA